VANGTLHAVHDLNIQTSGEPMKMFLRNHLGCVFVAGLLSSSLAACGGSNQAAETAEAVEDANDAEEEVEEDRHEEDLKAEEKAAEAKEDHYESVD
jgi:hypothetical protein